MNNIFLYIIISFFVFSLPVQGQKTYEIHLPTDNSEFKEHVPTLLEIPAYSGIEDKEKILGLIQNEGLAKAEIPNDFELGAEIRWFQMIVISKRNLGPWIFANELPLDQFKILDLKSNKEIECDKIYSSRILRIHAPYCEVNFQIGKNIFLIGIKADGKLTRLAPYLGDPTQFWRAVQFRLGWTFAFMAAMLFIIFYDILIWFVERKNYIFYMIMMAASELILIGTLIGVPRFYSPELQEILNRNWPIQLVIVLSSLSLALVFFFEQIGLRIRWLDRTIKGSIAVYAVATIYSIFFPEKGTYVYLFIAFVSIVLLTIRSYMIVLYDKKIGIFYVCGSLPAALSGSGTILSYIFFPQAYFWWVLLLLVGTILYFIALSVIFGTTASNARLNKVKLEQSLELGQTVQELLLPHIMEQSWEHGEHLFRYVPYARQMSGDWINHWVSKDGTHNFVVGDVTGKGPQAALAVAMISAIICHHKTHQSDLRTCLLDINKMLFQSFSGQITTTATAAAVENSGQKVLLVNAAGCGWFLWKGKKIRHILGQGGLLGHGLNLSLNPHETVLDPEDAFFTLTDGLCPTNKSMSRLLKGLLSQCRKEDSLSHLSEFIFDFSRQFDAVDDQAFFVYRCLPYSQSIKQAA